MKTFEVCESCHPLRVDGDDSSLAAATKCKPCQGTGIRRTNESFLCNACGEQIKPRGYGLIDVKYSGGYDSDHLWDLTSYYFSMCEKCMRDMFNRFVIPPRLMDNDIWDGHALGEGDAYAKDRRSHEKRLWVASGGQDAKFGLGICNAYEDCQQPAIWRLFQSEEMTCKSFCDEHRTSDGLFIPENELEGIAWNAELDKTQLTQLCDAIARHYFLGVMVLDLYANKHFYALLGLMHDWGNHQYGHQYGGIWIPDGKEATSFPSTLTEEKLPSGSFWWARSEELKNLQFSEVSKNLHFRCLSAQSNWLNHIHLRNES